MIEGRYLPGYLSTSLPNSEKKFPFFRCSRVKNSITCVGKVTKIVTKEASRFSSAFIFPGSKSSVCHDLYFACGEFLNYSWSDFIA